MNDVVQILRDLVSLNTVSSEPTGSALRVLASMLEPMGFLCETFGDDPRFQNLIARNRAAVEWEQPDKYLAFCAHVDTVPFDRGLWKTDPFELTESDGRLFGLGASDMKGPLACMLYSLATVSRAATSLPLALVVTHHEETALEGAQELVRSATAMNALRPMQLVIGEPTGLAVGWAHKGVFDFTLRIHGRAAHSGNPHNGLNAVYAASRTVAAIAALSDSWKGVRHAHFETGNTVNVGTFHGGDVRNRVPSLAVLTGDARLVPGSTAADVVARLREQMAALEAEGFRCEFVEDYQAAPFEMTYDSGMVRELHDITGLERITLPYATDAAVFQGKGAIDCVVMGPGDIRVCHMPNEFIETKQLEEGVALYTKILLNQRCAGVQAVAIER